MMASQWGHSSRSSCRSFGRSFCVRKVLARDFLRSLRSWSAKGQYSTLNRGGGRDGESEALVPKRANWSRRADRTVRWIDLAVVMMKS